VTAAQIRWLSLVAAADFFGLKPDALRRTIERRARLAADGVLEAAFDSIRARKFAGRWRIAVGAAWSSDVPPEANKKKSAPARATPSSRPTHATRPEKE
jgi:hypothetical protein